MNERFSSKSSRRRVSILCLLAAALVFDSVPLRAQQGRNQPNLYSPQLLSELKQLQEAALASDYAYRQVAHLSNNIGPRLTGSLQAQRAVEYVADEMKRLGLDVKLEKLMVPHWVRGVETGELVEYPGQAPQTTQKVVL